MKKAIIILIILIVISAGVYFLLRFWNGTKQEEQEYNPAEEITEEQLTKTMVTLYFKNKENSMLIPEPRLIDSKLLIINPYEELIKLLLAGPKGEELVKTIPEGTKINKVEITGDTVIVDFSKEFVENHVEGLEEETKTIYSIVNTLTELKEVNCVRILIDGEENKAFKDGLMTFENVFIRI